MTIIEQFLTASTFFVILAKVAPILLAALGGAFTQQGNILNIGLEGMMLIGAFLAVVVGALTGSPWIGVLAAVLSSLLLALLYAVATLWMNADNIVVGIGINLLAAGLTVFLLLVLYGNPGSTPATNRILLPRIDIGVLAGIPFVGEVFNNQTPLVWLALAAVPISTLVLFRTRYGAHLRAVGEDEAAATAAGIKVRRVKMISILISGVLCGFAGAQISMATLGIFSADMTAGRGFIAVAALTFGLARPVRTMVAAIIFGAAEGIADLLGIGGFNSSIALMVPYVVTLVALVLAGLRFQRRALGRRVLPESPS
jgi:ABC-type uncharacterized transport system permease subunit